MTTPLTNFSYNNFLFISPKGPLWYYFWEVIALLGKFKLSLCLLLMENDRNSAFTLLQPELLNEKQLREILISRCVSRNLNACSKDELVELFRSIALPLPQREYGDSRREKLLSKKQQKRRRISISNNESNSSVAVPSKSDEESKKSSKLAEDKVSERLKPPPDQINFQRKVIRLSDSAKKRINIELDKIVIKNKQNSKETTNIAISKDESSNPKRLCTSAEVNGKKDIDTKNSVVSTTAVKLKRNSLDINTDQKSEEKKKGEEKTPQKKRQKIVISW
ncbi:unnamed protein product [Nezara viridula]|uniref:Ashwin n=1 Tax=Nezara viridula TaxID=85310 RepID=A0A9P0E5L8_NEZVI|nr:unnamed protein product [Nezara viridula]